MNFGKKPQHDFPKMRGGSTAVWNFSENSSVLDRGCFPYPVVIIPRKVTLPGIHWLHQKPSPGHGDPLSREKGLQVKYIQQSIRCADSTGRLRVWRFTQTTPGRVVSLSVVSRREWKWWEQGHFNLRANLYKKEGVIGLTTEGPMLWNLGQMTEQGPD